MVVYLDVIWLLNVCFDALLLWLTALMLKRPIVWWRLLAGALIGSLLVVLLFTPFSAIAQHPLIKAAVSVLIVWAAFGFKRPRYLLENMLAFYFATFAVGGGMLAVHYFFAHQLSVRQGMLLMHHPGAGDPVSWLFVVIGFPVLWLFSRRRVEAIREKKLRFEHIIEVKIVWDGRPLMLRGLIDSGNQLVDPLTKTPVMVVEQEKAKAVLPEELLGCLSAHMMLASPPERWVHRLRLIPYRAVGSGPQIMAAVKPDRIMLRYENEWLEVAQGLVALSADPLSTDGEYDCIVHPKMVQAGRKLTAS
ncbi:sigma-E processing peptidase SpoIIGA [Geobacillus sp. JS12]|uniref:sigma-E processing peptidase SpoIIGA n=1 Tax=Geobacillus sp. JS12 TaxID=1813182 RepID=UPI00078B6B66|nr:sigma-E processing peptidase SpoIIGA [Geobacillus sp. JS12]AMQ20077.1 sigma-E processing peptidase SpoIIGA [Geobacillus sp. JS12]